jgi:ATP-dependent Lon protease
MSERKTLPVLSTRGSVVFPGPTIPIAVGRAASLRAVDAALKGDRMIFAVAQREGSEEVSPDKLYTMGVIARIGQVQRGLGGMQLLLTGEQRAAAIEYRNEDGTIRAVVRTVEQMPPVRESDPTFAALYREVRERAVEFGKQRGLEEEVLRQVVDSVTEPGAFADLVSSYLELTAAEKQALLETLGVEERLRRVLVHLQRQIDVFATQQQIREQVNEELQGRQRELYLREQMKAIQSQLGEGDSGREITALREKLAALDLPPDARAEADRELNRFERSGGESVEAQVIRNYLEWLAELPWNTRSDDNLELTFAEKVLDEDHYGLNDVKDRVLEFLSVRQLQARQEAAKAPVAAAEPLKDQFKDDVGATSATFGSAAKVIDADGAPASTVPESTVPEATSRALAKGPILLFVGPPGVGKTSIAKSIARSLGRKYVRIALGGVRDEADIRGHRRTYVGSMPGRIIQSLKQAGSKNPVILLDEVDKLGMSLQGDPASALLEVLDPAQNHQFTDHYLNVAFDLSEVLFIATANLTHGIPPALLDRMEVIEFTGYTEREKLQIAKRYLVPRQLEESGLVAVEPTPAFDDEALSLVISSYTRESGVRQLERRIGTVTRKLARRYASGSALQTRVGPADVSDLLGRPRVHSEQANATDEVGVATGMYYTPAGGDIMFVEAAIRSLSGPERSGDGWKQPVTSDATGSLGNVSLILTGQLGDVMKESARAALTYAATHADTLLIPEDRLGAAEVHVHVPAGAIPKDGPSAGVTIATALASALSGKPVRGDVAMTGEITLRGRVLPIGGVKEKVLGAHRAGIRHVILPRRNGADLEDVPVEVKNELEFHLVDTLDDVLKIALRRDRLPSWSPGRSRPRPDLSESPEPAQWAHARSSTE